MSMRSAFDIAFLILDPGIAILYSPDLLHSKSYLFAATLALCQEITIGLAI